MSKMNIKKDINNKYGYLREIDHEVEATKFYSPSSQIVSHITKKRLEIWRDDLRKKLDKTTPI
jgi:hypothetical protein